MTIESMIMCYNIACSFITVSEVCSFQQTPDLILIVRDLMRWSTEPEIGPITACCYSPQKMPMVRFH